MASLSIIVNVFDSHEAVRRQLLYLNRIVTGDCELIVVDDGSLPSLREICRSMPFGCLFTWCPTRDSRPWTQPRARNLGARTASSDRLLFFDIDHILTDRIIEEALVFNGDKFHWKRSPGVLDDEGRLITDEKVLHDWGWTGDDLCVHINSFVIRRAIFEALGGFDERFCGKYGSDDVDFYDRYQQLVETGKAKPTELIGQGFVFPDPSRDKMGIFHKMRRS